MRTSENDFGHPGGELVNNILEKPTRCDWNLFLTDWMTITFCSRSRIPAKVGLKSNNFCHHHLYETFLISPNAFPCPQNDLFNPGNAFILQRDLSGSFILLSLEATLKTSWRQRSTMNTQIIHYQWLQKNTNSPYYGIFFDLRTEIEAAMVKTPRKFFA